MLKGNNSEDTGSYSQEILDLIADPRYFGRMNAPSASSYLKGPCEDSMEFYLIIDAGRITEIKYYTEGCSATRVCAATAAKLAHKKLIQEALSISAADIAQRLKGLPEEHLHCSILAVSTLYRSIADYLLKP